MLCLGAGLHPQKMKTFRFPSIRPLAAVFAASCSVVAADWPQWHGPARDGVAQGAPLAGLPSDLKPVWKMRAGPGHSGPVVAGGRLIFTDDEDGSETVHCLDAKTGKELWKTPYTASVGDEWGKGPRATPAIDGDRVYTQSMSGELRCLALADGKILWSVSFEKDYGTKYEGAQARSGTATRRGNNGAPCVDGDALIAPVGSTNGATLVAFDKLTGKELWKSGNDEAAYSAPVVATIGGVRQVVHLNADALTGTDRASGRQLWRLPVKTGAKRHACTPRVSGDLVMLSSFSVGLMAVRVGQSSEGWFAKPAWENKDLKINLASPVLVGEYVYCQGAKQDYICASAASGQLLWSQPGFGSGKKDYTSTIAVGRTLLALTEDGTLVLIEANPKGYKELGRLQVCGNTWSFPAYSDGQIFVRDGREIACIALAR